jgi:hypothetical protein
MRANQYDIEEAIRLLERLRVKLPQHSLFGDDNWESIDLQRNLLANASYNELPTEDDYGDDSANECANWIINADESSYLEDLRSEFE